MVERNDVGERNRSGELMKRLLLSTVALLALAGPARAATLFPYADGNIGNLNVTGGAKGGLLANVLPFGYENAAVVASFINYPGAEAGFNGGWAAGVPAIAAYGTADTGAVYMEVDNQPPVLTLTGVTYDATHLYPHPSLTPTQVALLKTRMFIITGGATFYESNILSWAADGSSITVVGWAVPGGGNASAGQVPSGAGTSTAYVGVFNAFFTRNTVIAANPSPAFQALPGGGGWIGDEIDVVNNTGNYVIGGAPAMAGLGIFMISPGWTHGSHAAQALAGLEISGGFFDGILMSGINGYMIDAASSYATVFTVDNDGDVDIGHQGGTPSFSPCVFFHSNGSQPNPDGAICNGGSNPITPYTGIINALTNDFTVIFPLNVPTDRGSFPTAGNAVRIVPGGTGLTAGITTVGDTNGKLTISLPGASNTLVIGNSIGTTNINPTTLGFGNSTLWSANGSVATAMTSVGPTGSHTTVQEWFTVTDNAGMVRYIPAY